jgi:hypothetical protein
VVRAGSARSVRADQVSHAYDYSGNVDEELLAQARQAQEQLCHAERDADAARAEFHRAVHRLVLDSSSPRDIAAALGLSGRQLHKIIRAAAGFGRRHPPDTDLACTFCGRPQRQARKLITGPGVYICDACVELAAGVLSSGSPARAQLGPVHAVPEQDVRVRCRFCGRHRDQVAGMAATPVESVGKISGPAAICLECLSLCGEITAKKLG